MILYGIPPGVMPSLLVSSTPFGRLLMVIANFPVIILVLLFLFLSLTKADDVLFALLNLGVPEENDISDGEYLLPKSA